MMENIEQDIITKLFEVASGKVFKCQKGHRYINENPRSYKPNWKCIRCGKVLK